MLGDAWMVDVEGALAAGLRAVWFNRAGATRLDRASPARAFEPSRGRSRSCSRSGSTSQPSAGDEAVVQGLTGGAEICASIRADFMGPLRVHCAGTPRRAWSKSIRGARNLRAFRRDFD